MNEGSWYYSPDHGQLCKVIETQTLWGDKTCRVWLPGSNIVASHGQSAIIVGGS